MGEPSVSTGRELPAADKPGGCADGLRSRGRSDCRREPPSRRLRRLRRARGATSKNPGEAGAEPARQDRRLGLGQCADMAASDGAALRRRLGALRLERAIRRGRRLEQAPERHAAKGGVRGIARACPKGGGGAAAFDRARIGGGQKKPRLRDDGSPKGADVFADGPGGVFAPDYPTGRGDWI